MDPLDQRFEPIFIAGNVREIEVIEELLQLEEIEYLVQPAAFTQAITAGGLFYGLVFQVVSGQAAYCRQLFARHKLTKGIIPSDVADEFEFSPSD